MNPITETNKTARRKERTRPMSSAEALELLRWHYAILIENDKAEDAEVSMTMTVRAWGLGWNHVRTWVGAANALNSIFGLTIPLREWKPILTPTRRRTLRDVCEFVTEHATVPEIPAVGILGSRCRAAGFFLMLRSMMKAKGFDTSNLAPGTPLNDFAETGLPAVYHDLIRMAPKLIPRCQPKFAGDALFRAAAVPLLFGAMGSVFLATQVWQFGLPLFAIVFCLFLYVWHLSAAFVRQVKHLEFSGAETFADLCRLGATEVEFRRAESSTNDQTPQGRPISEAQSLELLRLYYRFLVESGEAEEADVTLDMSVGAWGYVLNDLSPIWVGTANALNFIFDLEIPMREWKPILTPVRHRTLRDVHAFLSKRVTVPEFPSVRILGKDCRPAGFFVSLRGMMEAEGVDTSDLAPSTPISRHASEGLPAVYYKLLRTAPSLAPHLQPEFGKTRTRPKFPIVPVVAAGLAALLSNLVWPLGMPLFLILFLPFLFIWFLVTSDGGGLVRVTAPDLGTFADLCRLADKGDAANHLTT